MPAYSFQEQFIDYIVDESKDHTVRKDRAGRSRHARPGEKIYLYYGMRTKWCRKIGEAVCSKVEKIFIDINGIVISFSPFVNVKLFIEQSDLFAWKDGFRPEGSTADHPDGAWQLMLRFWKQTHELPFSGVVIYWENFKALASKA